MGAILKIIQRKEDGKLFKPSHPGHPGWLHFYFKGIRPVNFLWFTIWKETGEVWKFKDGSKFIIL